MDYEHLKQQIARVNKAFYDRVYADPWLCEIFKVVSQEHIERQQTDFMLGAFGGPKNYCGRSPIDAHPHIFIDEEMWMLREKYLKEAFIETQFPEECQARWIKIDEAFKHVIVKKSLSDCKPRYAVDDIIYFPKPKHKKAG